jgi:hypothetical protein
LTSKLNNLGSRILSMFQVKERQVIIQQVAFIFSCCWHYLIYPLETQKL